MTDLTDWSVNETVGQFTVTADDANAAAAEAMVLQVRELVAKANKLVELMDQAETQHGGLIGSVTLRAKNELRLELSKWK